MATERAKTSWLHVGADPEMDLLDQQRRVEDEHARRRTTSSTCVTEVRDRQHDVQPRRLLEPADVERGEHRNHAMPPMMSPGSVRQRREERAQVVRDEERRMAIVMM